MLKETKIDTVKYRDNVPKKTTEKPNTGGPNTENEEKQIK